VPDLWVDRMGSKGNAGADLGGVCYPYTKIDTPLTSLAVKINLRLPSMFHGKKGFDRIFYAFKNVLTAPVTWLFINLQTQGRLNSDPYP
jgi:hypothetical protein